MTMPSITMSHACGNGEAAGRHQAEGDHGVDARPGARRRRGWCRGHDERHGRGHETGRGEHGGERSPWGQARMPAKLRIDGFTKMMYDMTMKVVRPAIVSRRSVVPLALNLKKRSSIPRPALGPG